jgi:DNA-binding HxlR family transcriptional regulator
MNEKPHLSCPLAKVALLLSDAWTMRIIHALLRIPQRFCELERSLVGISTRTLTLKLQKLIEDDIITKNDLTYELTEKGKKLKGILSAMEKFGASA